MILHFGTIHPACGAKGMCIDLECNVGKVSCKACLDLVDQGVRHARQQLLEDDKLQRYSASDARMYKNDEQGEVVLYDDAARHIRQAFEEGARLPGGPGAAHYWKKSKARRRLQ